MDNLLVDLDKVLDDFEAEENLAPGAEKKPSGFQEYLEQTNNQTWNDIENMETCKQYENNMYDEGRASEFSDKDLSSVRYDFPYEPEKFDLSEADFAPSTNYGESSYNGSLELLQDREPSNEHVINSLKQVTSYPGIQTQHINGNINDDTNVSENSQSEYGLLQAVQSKENNVLKLQVTVPENVKAPIQADNSPGVEPTKMAFQMNGHSNEAQGLEHSEKPVYHQQLSSIPSLNSINSSPEYDKYPVQCNTPQTPKDQTVNPFEAQLSVSDAGCISSLQTNSSQVKQKGDVEPMQDIPKLQNLKDDLEMSCDSRGNTEQWWSQSQVTGSSNSSRSLPATLHQTVFQNGANSTSSLPSELEIEAQHAEKSNQLDFKEMDIDKEQHDKLIENHSNNEANKNINLRSDNKEISTDDSKNRSLDVKTIVSGTNTSVSDNYPGKTTSVQKIVGFGNMDEIDDDTDLNAYLGDESEGVSNQNVSFNKTDTQLSKFSSENQTGHGFSNFSAENQDSLRVCDTEEVNKEHKEHKVGTKFEESDMDTSEIGDKTEERTSMSLGTLIDNTDNLNNRDSGFSEAKVDTKTETVSHQMENSDLEVFKILPPNLNQTNAVANTNNPVITNLTSNLSPVGNISLDSGVASLNDNFENTSTSASEVGECLTNVGARPKDSQNKVHINRPNSLMGLSTVDLKSDSPFVMKPLVSPSVEAKGESSQINKPVNPAIERMVVDSVVSHTDESRQLMENSNSDRDTGNVTESNSDRLEGDCDPNVVEMRNPDRFQPSEGIVTGRPRSWSPSDSGQPPVQKQKRPTSLNLPPPPTINPAVDREMSEEDHSPETDTGVGMEITAGENQDLNMMTVDQEGVAGAEGGAEAPFILSEHMDLDPPPPYSSTLGQVAPKWIPDAEAPICMSCESRFTFTKRRHHCRACGKVFCSTCCSMKNRLPYLKNQEARVCVMCHSELAIAERDAGRPPHPNNPSDYCSAVPPTHAASGMASAAPPSVLVPVLKRDGSHRQSAPKQVMFSDGIRPGGDLTELDGSSEVSRMPPRRSRVQKRVERVAQGQHSPRSRRLRTVAERTTKCLIPEEGLPPLSLPQNEAPGNVLLSNPDPNEFMPNIKDENKAPVIFAINTNLFVSVKIVTLDCCVNRTVWCFTTKGMTSVGQEEIVIVLESQPEENTPPKDVFVHLNNVFEDASKGNVITELGHSIFSQSFLGSRDHGGFLYIRASFQCVQKLTLPAPPFLFGILLQKWETPWAKVFPLRLLLRLGAEYRYYPCPLIGIRNRKPVFFEIGHTIMNLLADFRNYQYMLPNIRGVTIHMEDKVTKINFPRNRYEELMKVVNNSNEHVMAVAASFSAEADSHLVCIQNDDGNYQTQAINIQNKPRKVTGASFVVFNGALKTSSGLSAKSSIVEDGLMVQITPDSMLALKQAIRDMHDYPINCGLIGAPKPDETVVVQWVEDDKNINVGVKSPVDGMNMDGIESLHIHHATDYIGEKNIMRWTEIFFIQNEERGSPKWDPVDLSRIGETVATACCMALTQHLEKLKEAQLERIGLRVTLGADNVGYEAGAKGERLPDIYMNDLDNELIPVIHRATQPDINIVLELIFEVLD